MIEFIDFKKRNFRIDQNFSRSIIRVKWIYWTFFYKMCFISRISLQFKNDECNKNRWTNVFCQFIKRQFFVRSIFAIIINKSQNQSLRYVSVDIQMRNYFIYNQFYVIVFKITNKHNFYIIIFELNVLSNDFSREIIIKHIL